MRKSPTGQPNRLTDEVVAWRRERLLAAGFGVALARALARDRRYDLHALVELSELGCPPETAARILAPLDAAPGASLAGMDAGPSVLAERLRRNRLESRTIR
jgi:hypothetical protein